MSNNNWRSPPEIFAHYNEQFDFKCDVAADDHNHLCDSYITQEQNALKCEWSTFFVKPGEYVWCNPPYSAPLPWVRKCINESIISGIGSLLLLNHDMSVEWSSLLTSIGCHIEVFTASGVKKEKSYCNGRVAFIGANGLPNDENNKGQVVFIIPPFVILNAEPVTRYIPLVDVMASGEEILNPIVEEIE